MNKVFVAVAAAAVVAGCGGGSSSVENDSSTGTISIMLTDAAVDNVSEVWVEFAGLALKPANGDEIVVEFDTPTSINLLELQDGRSEALLNNKQVPVGPYNWIRLDVNAEFDNVFDSYALLDNGSQVELRIPSGSKTGLKLVSGFTVTANQSTNIMIDWDLRKALSDPRGQPGMHLQPALRVTDMAIYGSLSGTVEEALVTEMGPAEPPPDQPSIACTNGDLHDVGNAVYLYEGDVTDPLDIRGAETDPVVTATVTQNTEGVYEFGVSYLSVGSYTAAFTCQASGDDPELEDTIVFGAIINDVVIEDGANTHIEFVAPAPPAP
jgi:hypothetical protein